MNASINAIKIILIHKNKWIKHIFQTLMEPTALQVASKLILINYRLDQAIQLEHLQNFSQGGRQDCPFGYSATPIRAKWWFLQGISDEPLNSYFYSTCKMLAIPSSTGWTQLPTTRDTWISARTRWKRTTEDSDWETGWN